MHQPGASQPPIPKGVLPRTRRGVGRGNALVYPLLSDSGRDIAHSLSGGEYGALVGDLVAGVDLDVHGLAPLSV